MSDSEFEGSDDEFDFADVDAEFQAQLEEDEQGNSVELEPGVVSSGDTAADAPPNDAEEDEEAANEDHAPLPLSFSGDISAFREVLQSFVGAEPPPAGKCVAMVGRRWACVMCQVSGEWFLVAAFFMLCLPQMTLMCF